jgi:hypothetical protein
MARALATRRGCCCSTRSAGLNPAEIDRRSRWWKTVTARADHRHRRARMRAIVAVACHIVVLDQPEDREARQEIVENPK